MLKITHRLDGKVVDEKTFMREHRRREKARIKAGIISASSAPAARIVTWPLQSDCYGVLNPDQIDEAKAKDRAVGCEIQYTPDGAAVFNSRDEFRRWRDAHRLADLRK